MDYISLVNLVLVTVIYGTFIAPNLAKLSRLKESILELEFPAKVSAEGSEEIISQNGVTLSKKIAQYSTKYYEIQNFLRYFYIIVGILIAYQGYRVLFEGTVSEESIAQLICSIIVIYILGFSLNKYMSHPSLIRSFGWLTAGGIAPVYLKHMYKPKLSMNVKAKNAEPSNKNDVQMRIRSEVGFCGFNYILSIESPDSRFMYYVSSGFFAKRSRQTNISFESGQRGSEIMIGKIPLKEGAYKARLLFIGSFFTGSEPVHETIFEFNVAADGSTESKIVNIALGDQSSKEGYSAVLDTKRRIKYMTILPSADRSDESIERLLTFKPFIRAFGKFKHTFEIVQTDGQIDKIMLQRVFSRRNVAIVKMARILKRKNRPNYLHFK